MHARSYMCMYVVIVMNLHLFHLRQTIADTFDTNTLSQNTVNTEVVLKNFDRHECQDNCRYKCINIWAL